MQLIVQNIWMANTPSSAKARHSPSIRLCLVWSSYFIFGNLKKGRKKTLVWFRPYRYAYFTCLLCAFRLCVFNAVINAFNMRVDVVITRFMCVE